MAGSELLIHTFGADQNYSAGIAIRITLVMMIVHTNFRFLNVSLQVMHVCGWWIMIIMQLFWRGSIRITTGRTHGSELLCFAIIIDQLIRPYDLQCRFDAQVKHVLGSELRDKSTVRDGSELQLVECMDQNYFGMVSQKHSTWIEAKHGNVSAKVVDTAIIYPKQAEGAYGNQNQE